MPNAHTIKSSFSGGEFSPSLWSRVDLAKYATGARTLLNFIVHSTGGISNRPGTHKVAAALLNGKKVRLQAFEFASDENYVVEFGDYYCRFFYNDAQLTTAGTVSTPYAEADLPLLRFTQSADVLFIVHPDYAPRELQRLAASTWQMVLYDFVNGPFQLANDDTTHTMQVLSTSSATTLVSSAAFFFAGHAGGQMELIHQMEGQTYQQSITAATKTPAITCGGTWRIITHGTWTGKFQVEKSTQDSTGATGTWTCIRAFSSVADFNVDTYGSEDMSNGALPFLVRINMFSWTSGSCNVDLDTDPYQTKGVFNMTTYVSSTKMSGTIQRQTGSTATTSNWVEGAWSDYQGWPQTVTFSQDRLIFAGNYNQPQTLWMTQTGNYYDFFVNNPLVDSDGISINLPSQKLNEVNGMVSLLKLLVFTSGAEWSVGSDTGSILSPTQINTRMNSMTGSSGVQPVVIVNRAIYVQSRGCVVRDMGYDLFTDTFTGANLSILSNHLFFNSNIVEMAYQQDPDSLVWAIRDDGVLLSMTYLREQEVLAWTHHNTYDGVDLFESVCSIPGLGYNEVWFSVNRGGQRYIERLDKRLNSTIRQDQFFVDCGITFSSSAGDSYTKLLCHCDGVNQAVTFTDDAGKTIINTNGTSTGYDSYNKLMIHSSELTAGTFTPTVGGTVTNTAVTLDSVNTILGKPSMAFNGSAYLSIPHNADQNLANNDFTIQCIEIINSLALTHCVCAKWIGASTFGFFVEIQTNGAWQFYYSTTGSDYPVISLGGAGSITTGKHHLCVMRKGNLLYGFVDGVCSNGSGTSITATIYNPNVPLLIGSVNGGSDFLNGNMAEFRLDKGIARYPVTGFTPPTAPFGQVYVDTSVKKFGTGSARFLGGGEYLSLADSADWEFGTGDFTVDWWEYRTDATAAQSTIWRNDANNPMAFGVSDGANLLCKMSSNGVSYDIADNSMGSISLNQWVHWAVVRNGNTFYPFKNGILGTTWTSALAPDASTGALYIGNRNGVFFNGYIDELRISKGIARWTSDFAVPTSPYDITQDAFAIITGLDHLIGRYVSILADGNVLTPQIVSSVGTITLTNPMPYDSATKLMLHGSAFPFVDACSSPKAVTNNNVTLDTVNTILGLPSMAFNGTNAYLSIPFSNDFNFGSGDFTIESDVIIQSFPVAGSVWFFFGVSPNYSFAIEVEATATTFNYSINGTSFVTKSFAWVPTLGVKYHTVFQRVGNNLYFMVDGIQQGATADVTGATFHTVVSDPLLIGDNTGTAFAHVNFGEIRISKGIARFPTTGFTPPIFPYGSALASLAHVGLGYNCDLETLNVELGLPDGTLQGRKVQIPRVVLRLDNSRGGYLGPDFTHLYEILGDYKTSVATSLYTGDVKVNLGAGYSDGGRFCYRQSDPLPITILGVLPVVVPGNVTGI